MALVALLTMDAVAATLDVATARDLALRELNRPRPGRQLPPVADVTLAHVERSSTSAAIDYYVFNATDGNAFVIIAGDDRAAAVLGHGEGTFDINAMPCGMQWILGEYKQQLQWLAAHPDAELSHAKAQSVTVAPMLTSEWGQGIPYKNQCPTYSGQRCVTGCVATAMAQVMNYWKSPVKAPAIDSYKTSTYKLTVPALPKAVFDWDNMLDIYNSGSYSNAQATAVAMLMRYCGQACKVDYGPGTSSSWVGDQLSGMKLFNYNRDAVYVTRVYYSDDGWLSMLLDELSNGRPVLYTGYGNKDSHAFVIDGYDSGQYHINWGWDGVANGYFVMGAFNAGGYTLNEGHQMIVNLYPEPVVLPYDFCVNGIYYKMTSDTTVAVTNNDSDGNTYSGAVTIPPTVTFEDNTYQVTAIADAAFIDCLDLTEVTIPSTVTSSGNDAFWNCTSLKRVNIDDLGAWCRTLFPTEYANPLRYAHDLYLDGELLTDVRLPADVTVISHYAFTGSSIKRFDMGDGLQTIGMYAFYRSSLEFLAMGKSLQRVGHNAFSGCYSLKRVDIVDTMHWLSLEFDGHFSNPVGGSSNGETNARLYCQGEPVMTMVIPDTVTTIKNYTFCGGGCPALVIPPSVKKIGTKAFYYNSSIEDVYIDDLAAWCQIEFSDDYSSPRARLHIKGEVAGDMVIPESVTAIPDFAFYGCRGLRRVTASSVRSVGSNAFCSSSVTSFVSTASLRSIDKYAFSGCDSLLEVVMPNTVTSMGVMAFEKCTNLKSVTLSNSLKRIGMLAFSRCGLTSVTIPDAVSVIDEGAFYCCFSLRWVVFGARVESVALTGHTGAFAFCDSLQAVACRSVVPPDLRHDTFSATVCSNATLFVPYQSYDAYLHHGEWGKFAHIVGVEIHVDLPGDVNGDGSVNIADVNTVIAAILSGNDTPATDANNDGSTNITDVNIVIDYIIN